MALSNDDQVEALLGAHLLVGLTYLRPDGEIASRIEFHGMSSRWGRTSLRFAEPTMAKSSRCRLPLRPTSLPHRANTA